MIGDLVSASSNVPNINAFDEPCLTKVKADASDDFLLTDGNLSFQVDPYDIQVDPYDIDVVITLLADARGQWFRHR